MQFWAYFHSGMFWILLIILIINVIVNDRKEFKKGQYSENKSESSVGEIVMLIIIFSIAVVRYRVCCIFVGQGIYRHDVWGWDCISL